MFSYIRLYRITVYEGIPLTAATIDRLKRSGMGEPPWEKYGKMAGIFWAMGARARERKKAELRKRFPLSSGYRLRIDQIETPDGPMLLFKFIVEQIEYGYELIYLHAYQEAYAKAKEEALEMIAERRGKRRMTQAQWDALEKAQETHKKRSEERHAAMAEAIAKGGPPPPKPKYKVGKLKPELRLATVRNPYERFARETTRMDLVQGVAVDESDMPVPPPLKLIKDTDV